MSGQKHRNSPKIKLSGTKVFFTVLIIIIICILLLVITVVTGPNNNTFIEQQNIIQEKDTKDYSINKTENKKNFTISSNKLVSSKEINLKKMSDKISEHHNTSSLSSIQNTSLKKSIPKVDIPFVIPIANNGEELIFLFDDAGNNVDQLQKYLNLPFPISIAVLPGLPASVKCANEIRSSGKELLLHQPMQAIDKSINPGPEAIEPNMLTSEIRKLILHNLKEIGPVSGMNNHEGSLICENADLIEIVMDVAASQGIYFLDSRTTAATEVPQVAAKKSFPYYQRDIFLDNPETKEHILEEIKVGINIAHKKKSVIMIGHVWAADMLPDILINIYPILKEKGYKFCTISQSHALIIP